MRGRTKAVLSFAAVSLVGTLSFREARADDDMEVLGAVEGLSGSCPNLQFRVGTQKVSTDARTEFDDGACADLQNGARVEVEGLQGKGGVLVADEVDLRPDAR